ncbi:metal-dependent hydrolase [Haloarcula salina]|uniref:Metal-dependent hydrolase n=1 Tax=Haloarcula salina TaxID=1429914 RepID=A0AA41FYD1_9EURY|nr:metal-dependent hydrolase [Haloarcula salina]MBV0900179.1 metal-dependent hydrolase [Haloarcula salina]
MHRTGHYGVALAVYAPIGAVVSAAGFESLAVAGGVVAVGGAMTPDLDLRVPGISHRGITHTVWFALAAGVLLGIAGYAVDSVAAGVVGALAGVVLVGAHLLADALTPMGIRPFAPINGREYSLDVTTASNPVANYTLLAAGVLVAVGTLVLVRGGA